MLEQSEQLRASIRILRSEERRVKASIKERKAYYEQQEALIQHMVEMGNNVIRSLTYDADELQAQNTLMKEEIIDLNALLVDKRFELAMLGKL